MAAALRQEDRTDEAFAEYVAALLIDPADAAAHAGVGQLYLDDERYDEAADALRRAVDLKESDTPVRHALATALMRAGKTQLAAEEFKRVEDEQRRSLAERRRSMSIAVQKEQGAMRPTDAEPTNRGTGR